MWNKGARGVLAATRHVEERLHSALLGFGCDNGSEFLNRHPLRCLDQHQQPVAFIRSRPYHKDDQAHIEQKNWMGPCQLLGYGRREREEWGGAPICVLYQEVWGPLMNFFLPGLKLQRKGGNRARGRSAMSRRARLTNG